MNPQFIGLFVMKGFVDGAAIILVCFDFIVRRLNDGSGKNFTSL
jgi:hypothetical protein